MKKNTIATMAELALMGICVPVTEEDVNPVTQYILGVLDASYVGDYVSQFRGLDVLNDRIRKYTKTNDVAYVTVCMVYDDPVITYLLKSRSDDEEERYPDPFKTDYGTGFPCAFTYCFNVHSDMCSEFGDCFFKKYPEGYRRVS